MKKKYSRVLCIAGSDSGGGAGIQADIKSISACGAYASTAITALTVQNTLGVSDVYGIPSQIVTAQVDSVLDDIGADAIKIGMLYSNEIVLAIADVLNDNKLKNIVLDPILISSSGKTLLEPEAIHLLKSKLIPNVNLLTPNIPEAEILLEKKIREEDLCEAAKMLAKKYEVSVLVKGGHMDAEVLVDYFFDIVSGELTELKANKIITKNTHGTGCTISSSIAAFLAQGFDMKTSVLKAKEFTNKAILTAKNYEIGSGHGSLHHFYQFWE